MKKNIYLDDVRSPISPNNEWVDGIEEWTVVRSYDKFVAAVSEIGLENIGVISLDHDLGDSAMFEYYNNVKDNYKLDYENIKEMTGYDCCKFIVNLSMDSGVPLPRVLVHSANPIGSANMMGYINNYLKNCKLPQTCIRVEIPHIVEEEFILSPEAREAKWKRK